jgi:hypothetical protein
MIFSNQSGYREGTSDAVTLDTDACFTLTKLSCSRASVVHAIMFPSRLELDGSERHLKASMSVPVRSPHDQTAIATQAGRKRTQSFGSGAGSQAEGVPDVGKNGCRVRLKLRRKGHPGSLQAWPAQMYGKPDRRYRSFIEFKTRQRLRCGAESADARQVDTTGGGRSDSSLR